METAIMVYIRIIRYLLGFQEDFSGLLGADV